MTWKALPIVAALVLVGCKDPVPQGPDLVACNCLCTTHVYTGLEPVGPDGCTGTGLCDPPCHPGYVCSTPGACVPQVCGGGPPPAPSFYDRQLPQVAHACVNSREETQVINACHDRCQALGSEQASLAMCVTATLHAVGLGDLEGAVVPDFIENKINPNAAEQLTDVIVRDCSGFILDTLTGTCGFSTEGIGALVDLLLCVYGARNDGVATMARVCSDVSDLQGRNWSSETLNGCPQFLPDGGVPQPSTPIGGGPPAPASSDIMPLMSAISISGPDMSPAQSSATGSASTGRIGPIMMMSQLTVTLPEGHLTVQGHDVTLSNGFLMLNGPVAAVLGQGGAFTIPAGKLRAFVSGLLSGRQTAVDAVNANPVTGVYDETTGVFSLQGALALDQVNASVQFQLQLAFNNRPPIANAGPDQVVECTLPTREGEFQVSAAQSVDLDQGDSIARYTWTIGGQKIADGQNAILTTGHLGLGTRMAILTTVDTHGALSRDVARIQVVDTHPPVFPALAPISVSSCRATGVDVAVTTPIVQEACSPTVTVVGAVISSNGTALATPIPVQNGHVQLPRGNHVIRWTATDDSGNAATADQDVAVADPLDRYVRQLPNGDMRYSITFPASQAYVEAFVRQNGVQNVAGSIVSSRVANADGTFTYSRVVPASKYHAGDVISVRFYSYKSAAPGVFTPGPLETLWFPDFIYGSGTDCVDGCHPKFAQRPDGSVKFSATYTAPQSYVEAFVRRGTTQIAAGNIVGNGVANLDGTFSYTRLLPASSFTTGDSVTYRFYSYINGQPGVFQPGPTGTSWFPAFIYRSPPSNDCP